MRNIIISLALCITTLAATGMQATIAYPAADTEQPTSAPAARIGSGRYLSLIMDGGIHFLRDIPGQMQCSFWGSRGLSGYLYTNMPIRKSYFTFSLGLGPGSERYVFGKKYTLVRSKTQRKTHLRLARNTFSNRDKIEVTRSMLRNSYTDLVAELRFDTRPQAPKEGFFIALGASLGMYWHQATTVSYKEDNEYKSRTMRESFHINSLRYGWLGRVGWRRFGLYFAQSLSPLFDKKNTTFTQKPIIYSAGVSLDLF